VSAARVWLILPTFDEAENLEPLVEQARLHLPPGRRILVIDDASRDGTAEIADALAARHADVEVVHRASKLGLGSAYLEGFDRALRGGAELIVQMDCDFSHDPADLPRLLGAARSADLVIGSRYVEGGRVEDWGAMRRAISRLGSVYARRLLGVEVRDLTAGFKCLRRELLQGIDLSSVQAHGYAFQIELTYLAICAGYRVAELPVRFRDRRHGSSKMSTGIVAEAMLAVPAMRWRRRARRSAERARAGKPAAS